MKKNMISAFAGLSAIFWITLNPVIAQDQQEAKRQIKIVKVKDGNTTVVDTIIAGRGPGLFVPGDRTPDPDRIIEWVSRDVLGEATGDSVKSVIIIRKGQGEEPFFLHRRSGSADSLFRQRFMMERRMANTGDSILIFRDRQMPGLRRFPSRDSRMPFAPAVPRIQMLRGQNANVINLNDKGIISYKKKKMSGGREKITIIREEVKEPEINRLQRFVNPEDEMIRFDRPGPVRELDIRKAPPCEGRRLLETSPDDSK